MLTKCILGFLLVSHWLLFQIVPMMLQFSAAKNAYLTRLHFRLHMHAQPLCVTVGYKPGQQGVSCGSDPLCCSDSAFKGMHSALIPSPGRPTELLV